MYKQVIAVRTDLKMSKGKTAAQVAHASLEAYRNAKPDVQRAWQDEGSKKVVVRVGTLFEMLELHRKTKSFGIPSSLIKDAGKTELKEGTITCLGMGPDSEEKINKVTGKLKVL